MDRAELESFMDNLYEIGSVKFGEFYLSTGLKTPVYFDLRLIVSHPKVLQQAGRLIKQIIEHNKLNFEIICGVPYGAFAVATAVSIQTDKPMVFKRKEVKDYGCKKMVEGVYKAGDSCLLIEDVVVYGTSIIETSEALRLYDLNVTDAVTLLDRQQGGPENVKENNVNFFSVIKASDLLEHLVKRGKINQEKMDEIMDFLKTHSFQASKITTGNNEK
ncbi:unnamed protein product [Brachionus calyciflorus]|uniref:Uridine 5'-monophosphate synthase n=1 Tax=Brachionus calyciflorus TaxID=104777 RepID=A0A813NYY6_9BILA|nr:unnamed protein product [Brachionus calyciflorus]